MAAINLISWNINGLRAVINKNFLSFCAEFSPDILCLQEIKLQESQIPSVLHEDTGLSGYHKYWAFAEKKGYSGTAVFSKIKPISIQVGLGNKDFDAEGRTLTAEFNDFFLINTYFPNAQPNLVRLDFKKAYNASILAHLINLKKKKNVILTGDLNVAHEPIDLTHPAQNAMNPGFYIEERQWFTRLLSSGFTDTFRAANPGLPDCYTWWTYRGGARERNVGWRIDYVVCSSAFLPSLSKPAIYPEVFGSDHCPVGITILPSAK